VSLAAPRDVGDLHIRPGDGDRVDDVGTPDRDRPSRPAGPGVDGDERVAAAAAGRERRADQQAVAHHERVVLLRIRVARDGRGVQRPPDDRALAGELRPGADDLGHAQGRAEDHDADRIVG
jgi:hypothetical protein